LCSQVTSLSSMIAGGTETAIHFYDFGLDGGFLDMTPKAQETTEKRDK